MSYYLQVKNVSRKFGSLTAVDSVSFDLSRGEVLGFLGPNGAGKTTTMRMITGYIEPTEGSISVCGNDVLNNPLKIKKDIGYLPEGVPLYSEMTPRLFLNFIGNARGLKGDYLKERLSFVIENLGLNDVLDQSIETLSKGFKRRVAFAQAIIHDPKLLILDEPTDGLDPNQKQEVRRLIRQISSEKSIIISTHILEEVSAVCDRVIIISGGRKITDETPDSLISRHRYHNAVSLDLYNTDEIRVLTEFKALPGVKEVETITTDGICSCIIVPENSLDISRQLFSILKSNNWEFGAFSVLKGNMEEVFREMTTERSSIQGSENTL